MQVITVPLIDPSKLKNNTLNISFSNKVPVLYVKHIYKKTKTLIPVKLRVWIGGAVNRVGKNTSNAMNSTVFPSGSIIVPTNIPKE